MRERLRGCLFNILKLWILSPVYGLREAGFYWGAYNMSMLKSRPSMTSTLVDKYFFYLLPATKRSSDLVLEHEARVAAATPSVKQSLWLSLERYSSSAPDGLATILIENTLFAGTPAFKASFAATREK